MNASTPNDIIMNATPVKTVSVIDLMEQFQHEGCPGKLTILGTYQNPLFRASD
ncbi:hypothetical protein HK102_007597, partial [Quaeritorhiza haematococci]